MDLSLFLFLHDPVFWYLFQTAWNRSSNSSSPIQSDALRCISDNVVNIRQHNAPNYIYPRRKKTPLFISYVAFYVLFWTYMYPRSLLIWLNALRCFFILPLFRYTLFRKYQFLKEFYGNIFLLAWHVSCAYELFSVNLIVFAIKNFHEQLYVKDS